MDKSIEKLQSILEKSKNPIESLHIEVEIFGIYNLPESWKPTDTDSIEYMHTVTVSKVQFQNGKIRRRELTEEEHKALEESKKLKKDAPKKKGQESEVTAEEVLLSERRKKAQEEQRKKREEDIEKADEQGKYYLTHEDIYKNHCITWESDIGTDDFRLVKSYTQSVDKKPNEIVEFEECVEDAGGIYLDFSRLPKAVEEDPKKKVKGKTQEEVKPCSAKAWVDLRELQVPGKDELFLRPKLEESEGESIFKDTYVYLRIKVTPPITPVFSEYVSPTPRLQGGLSLIPDPTRNFRREIKLSALKIAEEYQATFAEQQGDNQRKLAVSRQKELREGRKENFLYEFNLSGKAQILKEKLKKAIVDVIDDSLQKKVDLSGLDKTDKDKLLSEAYAYLLEQMHSSVDDIIRENREALHEDIVIPWDMAAREKELSLINAPKENMDDKLLRLANEYELQGNIGKATEFHKERACRDGKNISIWMDFTRFCLRNGDISHAEEYIKEILCINESSTEHLLLLGSLLLQRKRYEEAASYLHLAAEKDFFHVVVNLVLSMLYKFTNKPGLEKKYLLIAKRLCLRHLGLLVPKRVSKGNFNPSLENSFFRVETAPGELSKNLTIDQCDDMYYFLTDYFLKEKLIYLAQKSLEEISNKDSSIIRYLHYKAQILFWRKDYSSCSEVLKDLLKQEPKHEAAWVLLGNALYFMNNHFDAEESYLKAVRSTTKSKTLISGKQNLHVSDYSILLRLGNIYLKRRAWADSKLVFSKCCEESPTSTSWTFLGLSCLYINELNEAEEALTEGNIMDEQNPINWGALAYLCAKRTEKLPGRLAQFLTCMNLAISYGLNDSFLLTSIGKEYIRIIFMGENYEFTLLIKIFKLAGVALLAQGKQTDDLVSIVNETLVIYKSKYPYKAHRIEDLNAKIIMEIKSI